MANRLSNLIVEQWHAGRTALREAWRVLLLKGPSQIQFWFIALGIGIVAGFAALGFRMGISWLQATLYGTDDPAMIHSFAETLDWYWIVGIPIAGGLVVGLILHFFIDDAHVRTVAEVIEGAALHDGRVEIREGLASAAASLITLSSGGSSGREGPVVHMAGVISSWVSDRINANGVTGRELLGCAVAAAVSASFNAPIAGALFAMEVVLRHFAVQAFAPITIAAVAGTVISRMEYGDVTEFVLQPETVFGFYNELPAFLLLGLVCGVVAVILMRAVFWSEDVGDKIQRVLHLPRYLRPALAGAVLGVMALWWPHIIGVGYETTSDALTGNLVLREAIVFAALKVAAVAVTMAGRMGGGIFSPSLMIGALTGLAYGMIATAVFPEVSGSETLYALAGMGAVAAAVLGAPISTTLIVFELTGDWRTGLAVMVAVSISSALSSRLVDRSYFLTQLKRRNIDLAAGPHAYLLSTFGVAAVMRMPDDPRAAPEEACWTLIEEGLYIDSSATLDSAMPVFERNKSPFIPVVSLGREGQPPELKGALFQLDVLNVFNQALAARSAEEHN